MSRNCFFHHLTFRNLDTVPPGFKYGASWEEDILFVEPETVCVDTNTTLDYRIAESTNVSVNVLDLVITDRGGFVNLNRSYPLIDLSDTQKNSKIYERAWKAAWMTNWYTMLYYVSICIIDVARSPRAPLAVGSNHTYCH